LSTKQANNPTGSGITIYLIEELSDARLRCEQLKRYVADAMKLVEQSKHKDHFFEVAGHLLHGIPESLFKLDKALSATALAATRLDYEGLKQDLRPEKVEELERVLEDSRIHMVPRRGDNKMTPKQASVALCDIADEIDNFGSFPLGKVINLVATLEGKTAFGIPGKMGSIPASSKVKGSVLRNLAKEIEAKPNRARTAQALRGIVVAQVGSPKLVALLQEATSRDDVMDGFKKNNPDLTKEHLETIADEWEKNRDVVKSKNASEDTEEDESEKDVEKTAITKAAMYSNFDAIERQVTKIKRSLILDIISPLGSLSKLTDDGVYTMVRGVLEQNFKIPEKINVVLAAAQKVEDDLIGLNETWWDSITDKFVDESKLHDSSRSRFVKIRRSLAIQESFLLGVFQPLKNLDKLIEDGGIYTKDGGGGLVQDFKISDMFDLLVSATQNLVKSFGDLHDIVKKSDEGLVKLASFVSEVKKLIASGDAKSIKKAVSLMEEDGLSESQMYRLALAADPDLTKDAWADLVKGSSTKTAYGRRPTAPELIKTFFETANSMFDSRVPMRRAGELIHDLYEDSTGIGVTGFTDDPEVLTLQSSIRELDQMIGNVAHELENLARRIKSEKTASCNCDKASRFKADEPADPTVNMTEEDAKEWKANTEEYGDKFKKSADCACDKASRFKADEPADPTENMTEEDAKEWKANTEEYGDKFKKSANSWKASTRKVSSLTSDNTLQSLLEAAIESMDGDASKADVDAAIENAAKDYEDAVEKALLGWVKTNLDEFALGKGPLRSAKDDSDVVEVMLKLGGGAAYLYFMEGNDEGVGTWDGDWDILFKSEPEGSLKELSSLMKSKTKAQFKKLQDAIESRASELSSEED
jgi:hypothetical protein